MIISNTQVGLENLCERAHYYRYIVGVEPKKLPTAIYRGVQGHAALEVYYREMREGSSLETCRKAAKSVLDKEIARIASETPEEYDQINICIQLLNLIEQYSMYYAEEPFKILEVEQDFRVPINSTTDYVMAIDMLVEMTKGENRGDLVVLDHKFSYNFKTTTDIDMDSQLPKYVWVLRQNGYVVSKGMFNQIRTRELKNPTPVDLFRREVVSFKSKKTELQRIWSEQAITANRIAIKMEDVPESVEKSCVRNMNLLVCRSCVFKGPCKAELNGDDITQMLNSNFQKYLSPLRQADLSGV